MNEDELRQAMAALEVYKAQLDSIAQNLQLIQLSLEELNRARETLQQYGGTAEGGDILVPIGGNSFVYAKVASNEKALVGVGSGVTIEKPIAEAVKTLEERSKELMESMKKLNEKRTSLENEAGQLSQAVQQEYQRMQQELQQPKR